jgi:hypothetical protein
MVLVTREVRYEVMCKVDVDGLSALVDSGEARVEEADSVGAGLLDAALGALEGAVGVERV